VLGVVGDVADVVCVCVCRVCVGVFLFAGGSLLLLLRYIAAY